MPDLPLADRFNLLSAQSLDSYGAPIRRHGLALASLASAVHQHDCPHVPGDQAVIRQVVPQGCELKLLQP